MDTTHLTLRDREELATASGILAGIARIAAIVPTGELNREGLQDGLRRAIAGIDAVLERDLERRGDGPKEGS